MKEEVEGRTGAPPKPYKDWSLANALVFGVVDVDEADFLARRVDEDWGTMMGAPPKPYDD